MQVLPVGEGRAAFNLWSLSPSLSFVLRPSPFSCDNYKEHTDLTKTYVFFCFFPPCWEDPHLGLFWSSAFSMFLMARFSISSCPELQLPKTTQPWETEGERAVPYVTSYTLLARGIWSFLPDPFAHLTSFSPLGLHRESEVTEYSGELLRTALYLDFLKYLREIGDPHTSFLGEAPWMIRSCFNKSGRWMRQESHPIPGAVPFWA